MWDFLSKRGTKAVNNSLTGNVTSIQADFPSSVRLPGDSQAVLQYIRGYAASCINLISKSVGGLPYYMYRVSNSESGTYLGKSLKVRDKRIEQNIKAIKLGDYTLEKVFEHPFLQLIEGDTDMSTVEILQLITGYMLAIGNAYLQIVRDEAGTVIKLKMLMSEFMSVKYDKEYNIVEYVYQPALSGYTTQRFTPDQLIHISNKVPGSLIAGRGVLEDALLSVSIAEESKKFTNSLLVNHMIPSQNIIVKNTAKTEDEAKKIKDKLMEQYSGDNRGKVMVSFGDITIESNATTIKDEEVLRLCAYCKTEIASQFGVPIDLLDQTSSNRASIISAKANFYKLTVFPLAENICSQISRFIAKEYDSSFILNFDTGESIENDPAEQATLFKTLIDAGVMTVNEARAKLGMSELEQV